MYVYKVTGQAILTLYYLLLFSAGHLFNLSSPAAHSFHQ